MVEFGAVVAVMLLAVFVIVQVLLADDRDLLADNALRARGAREGVAGQIHALERANGVGDYAYRMRLPHGGFLYSPVELPGYEPTPFTEP